MKRILTLTAIAAMTVVLAAPATAQEAQGEVREIIIKIETPEGTKWYSLGSDLSDIDISKGAVVRFNYADDTIEAVDVEDVAPGDPPAATQ